MSETLQRGDIIESLKGLLYMVNGAYDNGWIRAQRCRRDGLDVSEGRGAVHWLKRYRRLVRRRPSIAEAER